ncbi:MAG: CDP-alcohol phosphatidyltransferase family protein [Myxococcales bacterium]
MHGPPRARGPAWIKPVPNLISAGRIGLAAWFPFAPQEWWLVIALGAGLSDGLDGYVARRFEATSWQGGLLDAAADKLFTTVALLTLTHAKLIAAWQLPLLMTRDIVVVATCVVIATHRRWDDFQHMQSRLAGKATTFLLFGLMAALLLPLPGAVMPLLGLSMAGSFAAATDYAQSYSESH